MKVGHGLLLCGAGLLLFVVALGAAAAPAGPQGAQPASAAAAVRTHYPAVPPNTTSADYLGSKACSSCHQEAFDQWQRSLHVRMTKPIAEATVVGDFSGTKFSDHGRSFEFGTASGKP